MSIPETTIDRIKREVAIRGLVESHGVRLVGTSDNLKGLCPFHSESTPSLIVSPAKGLWHCFGACQTGGSVIDWVMKAQGVGFREAVAVLEEKLPPLAAPGAAVVEAASEVVVEAPAESPAIEVGLASDVVTLQRAVTFYHRTLREGGDGLAYLASRGLDSAEVVEAFQLGHANRSLGLRLPGKATKAGAAIRAQLQRLGILRPSGHELFNGSLVVPVFGEDGEVLEIYGRKLRPDVKFGSDHLYLPRRADGRRGVFNLPGVKSSSEVILCEALIDALTFWSAGFRNVTSAYGVEGFTEEMLEAFTRAGVRKVLIAYDRDEAGDRAASRLAPELAHRGFEVFRVLFPKGMDANEYASKVKPAPRSLEAAIRGAQWMAGDRPVVVPGTLGEVPPHDPVTGEVIEPVAVASDETPSLAAPAIAAAAEPAPLVVADELGLERLDGEVRLVIGDRRWRLRGLRADAAPSTLKLNAFVSRGNLFFVDTLELYSARQRGAFVKQAAEELGLEEVVLKGDLGKILLRLEGLLEEDRRAAEAAKARAPMSESERAEALALLRDPRLLERVLEAFDQSGVVGEETNKLVAYLAAVSRKLEAPLAVVIQSSSAAGKSSLMDAVLRLVPEEDRVQYSAMTGQSLFYMGETDLSHKILAIAEEQGAQSASYALKLLQSDGALTIASTGKDPATGRLLTHEYRVQGPVMIFMTTTAIEVDEELLNRCLVLTVDEGAEQTAAIHQRQREAQTLEGLLARRARDHVQALYQNAQRLLEPLLVTNPFAPKLSFDHRRTRSRRDHVKYLTLIRAIAFLHQHQRPIRTVNHLGQVVRYIEANESDIAMADRLSRSLFGRSDELPAQTERVLEACAAMVRERAKSEGLEAEAVRFTRRELRERTGLGHTQLRLHLGRLEELEYLVAHGGGGKRRLVYGLAGPQRAPNLAGVEANLAGGSPSMAGGLRALGGGAPRQELLSDLGALGDLGGGFGSAHLEARPKSRSKSGLNGHAAAGK